MFNSLKWSLKTRLYKAVALIEREQREERRRRLMLSFRHMGCNPQLEDNLLLCGAEYISIGNEFRAGNLFRLNAIDTFGAQHFTPEIVIGDRVSMEDFCHVGCIEKVTIGDGTMLASKVFISDHSHGNVQSDELTLAPIDRKLVSKPVSIGRNCWIGEGACILPGVILGDNVVVGANAVVTHSFPANSIVAGCPAKLLRTL